MGLLRFQLAGKTVSARHNVGIPSSPEQIRRSPSPPGDGSPQGQTRTCGLLRIGTTNQHKPANGRSCMRCCGNKRVFRSPLLSLVFPRFFSFMPPQPSVTERRGQGSDIPGDRRRIAKAEWSRRRCSRAFSGWSSAGRSTT